MVLFFFANKKKRERETYRMVWLLMWKYLYGRSISMKYKLSLMRMYRITIYITVSQFTIYITGRVFLFFFFFSSCTLIDEISIATINYMTDCEYNSCLFHPRDEQIILNSYRFLGYINIAVWLPSVFLAELFRHFQYILITHILIAAKKEIKNIISFEIKNPW